MSNEAERRRWNDAYWSSIWPRREAFTARVTPILVDRLSPADGAQVLEVGCGGGTASFALAERVGPGRVVGVDLSASLVSLAEERAAARGAGNVSFVVGDAQEDPLPAGPFDVVASQFGVMFFDEPSRAFSRLRGHTRPGGRLGFACWRDPASNPWNVGPALAPFLPTPPGPAAGKSATGPFSLADAAATAALLSAAGWGGVEVEAHDLVVAVEREALFEVGELDFRGVPADRRDDALAAVEERLDRLARPDGRLDAPLAFWTVTAVAPLGA